jgi:hypothetical protein
MSNAKAEFKDLKKQMANAKKTMQETAQRLFTEMSADLFKKHPNLLSFAWQQYTPYWNDGDTCTFSALTEYPTVTIQAEDGIKVRHNENYGETVWLDPEDEEIEHVADSEKYEKEIEKVSGKVADFLQNFEDEDLEIMFGDHMEITVHANGKVDTESYDHE